MTQEYAPIFPQYPEYIMQKIRQYRGLGEFNTSQDGILQAMSHDEAFAAVLNWEGIIGYEYQIKDWIQYIYGVTLT